MFSFGADSDDEDNAFADRNLNMHNDFSSVDESSTLGWDASLPGQFSTQAARFPGGPPRNALRPGSGRAEAAGLLVPFGRAHESGLGRGQSCDGHPER